jgi:CcmD family protein
MPYLNPVPRSMRRFVLMRLAMAGAALLLVSAAPVRAQVASPASAPSSAPSSPPAAAPSAAPHSTGLPGDEAPAPPRTLRAYWHVWIAFSVAWILLFGYVLMLGRRFARLEAEVGRLS